jgi:hypothetical protein
VDRVAEALVSGVAGQHDGLAAAGTGDRGGAGVVLACLGVGQAVRVVAELAQHPGTKDHAEAGLAAVAPNVRVLAKPSATTASSSWASPSPYGVVAAAAR